MSFDFCFRTSLIVWISNARNSNLMVKLPMKIPDRLSIAFETNGKGYIGFIAELPGAYVRGRTEEEALDKVKAEARSYLKWLGIEQERDYTTMIVQSHHSKLMVEDADNEILLDSDRGIMEEAELRELARLVRYSGETFLRLYRQAHFKKWVDEARIRRTFHGENPKTMEEVFNHVRNTQYYYLSRTKVASEQSEQDFVKIREYCLRKIEELYQENTNVVIFDVDNELWTLKKILRRFVWHDRIHGKAITRILEKQRQLRIIENYEDPFHFSRTVK